MVADRDHLRLGHDHSNRSGPIRYGNVFLTPVAKVPVAVCRGCCCGTAAKHGEIDHQDQIDTLRTAVASLESLRPASTGRVWATDCLGPCDRSNVIVVRSGAVRLWFGPILSKAQTKTLAKWVAGGAPGHPPEELEALVFQPAVRDEARSRGRRDPISAQRP